LAGTVSNVVKGYLQTHVDDRFGPTSWIQPAYRAIAAEVALEEGAFLDLHADAGWICIHVAAGKPELDAIGIVTSDDEERLADTHKQRRLNVTFRQMQPHEITYPADTFGCVLAHCAVQHWDDPAAVLAEMWRVMVPGARLLVYDPQPEADIPDGWVVRKGGWPPESFVRRHLRANAMDDATWEALKATVKASKFGGGQEGSHGFYRRMVLTRG
jgi:SAM-dependent methyltransferase